MSMTAREISVNRIKELSKAYIEQRNQEILKRNEIIDKQNKHDKQLHKEKYASYLQKPKFTPTPHEKKYKIKNFTEEISENYQLSFDYLKYTQYIKGVAYPSLELLHALSETFEVSLDYLCGYDDIPNRTTATISTILPLKEESLLTLVKLCSNTTYASMINALLSSPDATAGILQNIRQQLQQRFEQDIRIQRKQAPSRQQLILSATYSEELLARLEHVLLPVFKKEFETKVKIDDAFINRDTSHYLTAFHRTKKDSQ